MTTPTDDTGGYTIPPALQDVYDTLDLAVDTDPLKLRDALWAVLAIERTDRRFVRADDPETTQWMVGHDAALDDVRKAIASALGVRFYPTDKITTLPTNKASQP